MSDEPVQMIAASRVVARTAGVVLALLLLCVSGFAADEETPKKEVVPGSDVKIENAMTWADAIVVAAVTAPAEIVDRNSASISYSRKREDGGSFGDIITCVRVRQRVQVSQSLLGPEKVGEITLVYSYVEQSELKRPESPLKVSDERFIVWIKEKSVLKAIPATPENLDAVKKLLAEGKKP